MSRRMNSLPRKRCIGLSPDDPFLFADGYDEAILGITWHNGVPLVVYSTSAILTILRRRDRMTRIEADEFFEFNIQGAWMGEKTPLFVKLI